MFFYSQIHTGKGLFPLHKIISLTLYMRNAIRWREYAQNTKMPASILLSTKVLQLFANAHRILQVIQLTFQNSTFFFISEQDKLYHIAAGICLITTASFFLVSTARFKQAWKISYTNDGFVYELNYERRVSAGVCL